MIVDPQDGIFDDENFDDCYDDKSCWEMDELSDKFSGKVEELALHYIEQFFKDKKLFSGGKIPSYMLRCKKRISMVMNYDIIKGVDHAYAVLDDMVSPEEKIKATQTGEATENVKLVIEILDLLAKSHVPKQFAGGIMILYLEFIRGVQCNRI
jgi:hypothetical protein